MAEILLLRGEIAFVDDEDLNKVLGYRWHRHSEGYAVATIGDRLRRKNIWMHALVSGILKPDHRDGNKLNNRKVNLRPATSSQNSGNRKVSSKPKSSKFKGVCWNKRLQSWRVLIKAKCAGVNHQKELGHFKDETEAARAYNRAATALFGQFANLNPV